jgi:hypothetical protein
MNEETTVNMIASAAAAASVCKVRTARPQHASTLQQAAAEKPP